MALEGLLTKLGPSVVRELTPHVMQMVAGLADRLRKDTGELRASVDSEITALGALQQETNARVRSLGEAGDATRLQLITLDQKLDGLIAQHEALAGQLNSLEHALRTARTPPSPLLWGVLGVSIAGFAVTIALLFLRH